MKRNNEQRQNSEKFPNQTIIRHSVSAQVQEQTGHNNDVEDIDTCTVAQGHTATQFSNQAVTMEDDDYYCY